MDQFEGLTAIVQYSRKDGPTAGLWFTMAAFDVEDIADKYARDCTKNNTNYNYRWVKVKTTT